MESMIKKPQYVKYIPHYKRNSMAPHLKKNHIIKKYFLLSFFLLHFPLSSFGFSETEVEALEATGKKSISSKPWRTLFRFSIKRNTLLNSSYTDRKGGDQRLINPLDPKGKNSLLDSSSFYYTLSLNVNYSLKDIKSFDFLQKAELFLSGLFNSPITGYRNYLEDYGPWQYIHYGLGDIKTGLTIPVYRKETFFSDASLALMPYPLSRFSQEAGLISSVSGSVSFLYFLKKEAQWNLALSSNHNLVYRHYTKAEGKDTAEAYVISVPLSTNQMASIIYRQNGKKYLPSSVSISSVHYLGIDAAGIYNQDLTLSLTTSWKIKNRLYLNASLSWKDRLDVYHPKDSSIRLRNNFEWFKKDRTVISFGGLYSF